MTRLVEMLWWVTSTDRRARITCVCVAVFVWPPAGLFLWWAVHR